MYSPFTGLNVWSRYTRDTDWEISWLLIRTKPGPSGLRSRAAPSGWGPKTNSRDSGSTSSEEIRGSTCRFSKPARGFTSAGVTERAFSSSVVPGVSTLSLSLQADKDNRAATGSRAW